MGDSAPQEGAGSLNVLQVCLKQTTIDRSSDSAASPLTALLGRLVNAFVCPTLNQTSFIQVGSDTHKTLSTGGHEYVTGLASSVCGNSKTVDSKSGDHTSWLNRDSSSLHLLFQSNYP